MIRASWPMRPLSRCARFLSGGTPDKARSDFWEGDIPWVSSGEMTERRIFNTPLHISEDGAREGSRLVPENTVLGVVRGMSLAKEFRVAITRREVAFNQDLKAFACEPDVDAEFLFYALLARRQHIRELATEASHGTKRLETDVLSAVQIHVPKNDIQRRVVSVISAYDDLIENNRRRMALLEEAARQLYREWFVRLRFPGHEHTRITNGVPEGWERKSLFEIATPTYGHPFQSSLFTDDGEGLAVVRIRNVLAGESSTFTLEEAPSDRRLQNGDLLIGMDGDFHMGLWAGGDAWLNQRVVRIKSAGPLDDYLLFWLLRDPIHHFNETITGTTVVHLGAKELKTIRLLVPSSSVRIEVNELFAPLGKQIVALKLHNRSLRVARDLLLPRLMSGEIIV